MHELEREYGLFKDEILDAINRRFRAKVTLEGAVAEVHLGKHIQALKDAGIIERFEVHDQDGYPDYSLWLPGWTDALRVECKNVRDSEEAYRQGGEVTAYKVETQKTRASKGDRSSRFYGYDQFEILAVCMGKKTHDWHQFMFIQSKHLARHSKHKNKMAVMHPVPLPGGDVRPPWYPDLGSLLEGLAR
ncbi:MAG: hypothetical protein DYG83_01745 [Candidatus Brocadia sp. AMX2]|nr:hypothetical protein [Candidatus Brocadia sp.]MBL1167841.1 hypothetical protein [Candidatus Brocadia sp. AMX1]MCE7865547.1 hypothetical protein [Candidatus Brocadia sp. AMX2]NOG41454.1 hypothetical protein [Planctomycetota bacterium]NUO04911.1 hypothetical protein [Candidatus Brocadia sinica]